MRRKNEAMAWIHYEKAYDMVQQRWIDCLKMYKISDKIIKFIEKIMKKLESGLTAGGKSNFGENPEIHSREIRYHHYYL